jgi:micrococcal nuclease
MLFKTLTVTGLILALAAIGPCPSWADFKAKVLIVHDGDRLTIFHNGRREMIYVKDIDCPELKQPYGKQAKRTTMAYIGGREVVVRGLQRNHQGRTTAEVLLLDGRNVGHELVKEGLAWASRDTVEGRRLGEIEQLARAEGKGLWSQPNPMPPWKWRQKAKVKR